MRLKTTESIYDAISRRLEARLDTRADHPVALAFSGGGDSLAMLLATERWARRAGRELLVLTVDHRLRPDSRSWTEFCAARAERIGLTHRALVWTGEKPATGLPAAARAARHALLAESAREAGAAVILMGHTADDILEARAMRSAGSTVPSPHEWAPSPVWPEGRGVFLLRPMLALRRAALREALANLGETWIDDPANENPASLRARVRREAACVEIGEDEDPLDLRSLYADAEVDWTGAVTISRAALEDATPKVARAFLSAAVLCASGASRPPRGDQLDRVRQGVAVTTLAGARVEWERELVRLMRDPGRLTRETIDAAPGRSVVFDGRFELAPPARATLVPSFGRLSRLPRAERAALKGASPAARRALPLAKNGAGEVSCPLLDPGAWRVRNLVKTRLMAACGVVQREATLSHLGETNREPLNQGPLLEGLVHELA